jgi:acyl-[acyl-carrier-protein]-phospholipid O-acyltransferase/long-chain-fatty-acid--[acyl-carrier-protein] ligase
MAEAHLSSHPETKSGWRRGFWSLIATQFQGAFSDNALKNLVLLLILGSGITQAAENRLVPFVLVLFAVPFVLFSMAGGQLADRYSKRSVTIATKVVEIAVALVALAGLGLGSFPLQLAAIFLFSSQAALFGPSKYGLLPEVLPQEKLSWGNGILEMTTFMAIITGTILAGFLSESFRGRQYRSGLILVGLAILGTVTSLGIPRVRAWDPSRRLRLNFIAELWNEIREMRSDRILFAAVVANTFFWFLGGLLQPVILLYGKKVLLLDDQANTFLQGALAGGIGIGSVAAGIGSGGKIEYGLVPAGALGLTLLAFMLSHQGLSYWRVLAELAGLGFFAGVFAVPVNALLQHRPAAKRRGTVLAAANLLSFVGVFVAGIAYYIFVGLLHLSPGQVFVAGAMMTLAIVIYVAHALPDSLLRMWLWLVTHSIYWLRVEGREHLEGHGEIVIVGSASNYESRLLLRAATEREVRFAESGHESGSRTIRAEVWHEGAPVVEVANGRLRFHWPRRPLIPVTVRFLGLAEVAGGRDA